MINSSIFLLKDNNKPHPKPFIAYITSLLYFLVGILLIVGIVFLLSSDKSGLIFCITAGVAIIAMLIFFNFHYEWFLNVKVTFNSNEIIYTFDEVISVLGHTEVKDEITKIDRIVIKNSKIIIYGDILHYEPLQKPKNRKKVELPTGFNDEDKLIEKLHEFKERTGNE